MKDVPEDELLAHVKAGNEEAKEAMTEMLRRNNQRLRYVAVKYGGQAREDAVQAGSLELCEHMTKYEDRGHSFGTFAKSYMVKAAVKERQQTTTCGMTGRDSDLDKHQGAVDLGVSTDSTYTEQVHGYYSAEYVYESKDLSEKIRKVVESNLYAFTDVQREIINCRLLAEEGEKLTQAELAKRFGLTPQAIGQHEKRIEEILRPALAHFVEDLVD